MLLCVKNNFQYIAVFFEVDFCGDWVRMLAMKIHSNPIYRKAIIPWYDSDLFCIITLILLFLVFYFGLTGIWAAAETPDYQAYVWVPAVLALTSLLAGLSMAFRLAARIVNRYRDYD
jgi:hypothetical protein